MASLESYGNVVLDLEPFYTAFPASSSRGEEPDINRLATEIREDIDGTMFFLAQTWMQQESSGNGALSGRVKSTRSTARHLQDFVKFHWKLYKDKEGSFGRNGSIKQSRALRSSTLAATNSSLSRARHESESSAHRHVRRSASKPMAKEEKELGVIDQKLDGFEESISACFATGLSKADVTSGSASSLHSSIFDAPDSPLTVFDSDEELPDMLSLVNTLQETSGTILRNSPGMSSSVHEEKRIPFPVEPPSEENALNLSYSLSEVASHDEQSLQSVAAPGSSLSIGPSYLEAQPSDFATDPHMSILEDEVQPNLGQEAPRILTTGVVSDGRIFTPYTFMSQDDILASLKTIISQHHAEEPRRSGRHFFSGSTAADHVSCKIPRHLCHYPSASVDRLKPVLPDDNIDHENLDMDVALADDKAGTASMSPIFRPIQDQMIVSELAPVTNSRIGQSPSGITLSHATSTMEVDEVDSSIIGLMGKISDHRKRKTRASSSIICKRETYAMLSSLGSQDVSKDLSTIRKVWNGSKYIKRHESSLKSSGRNPAIAPRLSSTTNIEIKDDTISNEDMPTALLSLANIFVDSTLVEVEPCAQGNTSQKILARHDGLGTLDVIDHNRSQDPPQASYLEAAELLLSMISPAAGETHVPVNVCKPKMPRKPPIWSISRQELCESLEWFRSYQGGVYAKDGIARGYLLSAFGSDRDIWHHDGRLIISHGGGRAESITFRGGSIGVQQASNQQAEDRSVRALLETYRKRRPLVLICDDRYTHFPFDLSGECTYVVLGFYRIIHFWAERQITKQGANVVRFKFAFQWVDESPSSQPWWWFGEDKSVHTHSEELSSLKIEVDGGSQTVATNEETVHSDNLCELCSFTSPQIYEQGWTCLQPNCSAFWANFHEQSFLTYSQNFLRLVSQEPIPEGCTLVHPQETPIMGGETITTYTRGWHCKKCGRLSSRFRWQRWECSGCGNTHSIPPIQIVNVVPIEASKRPTYQVSQHSGILTSGPINLPSGEGLVMNSFLLPQNRGLIHHISARNPDGNWRADQILRDYQLQAEEIGFRRWPLRNHKCRGELLTNYFSQNSGEPYHYVAGTDGTVPLHKAASAIQGAWWLIRRRVRQAIKKDVPFNEILSAGYLERQSMAFHSDSEKGLGPVVSSLSLGASAVMHFRLLRKHRGAVAPGETQKRVGKSLNELSIMLRHGDIIIMEGADIQNYYEHTVIPDGYRIAATARVISPFGTSPTRAGAVDVPAMVPVSDCRYICGTDCREE